MAQPPRSSLPQTMQEAVALHQQRRLREAEKLYARVLKAAPEHFDALHLLGLAKAQGGQMGEAFRLMSVALKINPKAPDAWMNLANVLHALKRDTEALDCLDKALALRPGDPDVLHNRGNALLALGRPQDALACFDAVLVSNPRHADALVNRGSALASLGRTEPALADFDAALALMPSHPATLYNRGNALSALGRYDEAIAAFDRGLAAAPNHVKAWNNRGRALQALDRHADAVDSFRRAIELQKDYADAHFNRALSLLTLGDLRHGFEQYEWRWKRSGMSDTRRGYGKPLWLGEYPLARKSILLHAEQGLGDTIQFARYAPLLARAGARVVLEVQAELKTLLASLEGVAACHARGETLPAYDVHCPLGSLPLALKTEPATIPADIPYLRADEIHLAKWRPRIEALPGKRVALAWSGNASHANDRNRSIYLALLEPLLVLDGVSFLSIQRELRGNDAELLARHANITHLGGELADMTDTAAVAALADLTISVDTSVVHLAGSLDRPVWVMLPFAPDWRWTPAHDPENWEPFFGKDHAQTKSGTTSPWYPQARLFRQCALGDWASVIATLRAALIPFIAAT
ncbi:MAG TPA: tetratricopeptide repeat-containing glycosyltransferase family protein [Pseudolabrys sp.]|nr:tetratricopeptide repeat-containing glycosyltransferase family protein [Pseudolabrys sp.]